MAEGRRRDAWDRTSHVLATLINLHKTKGRPVTAAECNPFTAATAPAAAPKGPIKSLRGLFVDGMGFQVRKTSKGAQES